VLVDFQRKFIIRRPTRADITNDLSPSRVRCASPGIAATIFYPGGRGGKGRRGFRVWNKGKEIRKHKYKYPRTTYTWRTVQYVLCVVRDTTSLRSRRSKVGGADIFSRIYNFRFCFISIDSLRYPVWRARACLLNW
jgi:hypothetical protein